MTTVIALGRHIINALIRPKISSFYIYLRQQKRNIMLFHTRTCVTLAIVAIACFGLLSSPAFAQEQQQSSPTLTQQQQEQQTRERARFEPGLQLDRASLDQLTADWSEDQRTVMNELIEKYGPPDEGTESYLIWHENSPFARTVLSKETDTHNFPMPHEDFLEQTVKLQVPVERYEDVTRLSGSLTADRTRGELSSRCKSEKMNTLALNLAHEVINGERTAEDARHFFAETAHSLERGETVPYVQELRFPAEREGTADPDQAIEVAQNTQ